VKFLQDVIFKKYKNHLIILDNAGSHNNDYVKDKIIKNDNKYLLFIFFIIAFPNSYNIIFIFFNYF